MATEIKVEIAKGQGEVAHLEINGGQSGKMSNGHHEFTIGQQGAMVQYLTIQRLSAGDIKVLAETGDVYVEVDGGDAKRVKKGGRFSVSSRAKRVAVRERPHR